MNDNTWNVVQEWSAVGPRDMGVEHLCIAGDWDGAAQILRKHAKAGYIDWQVSALDYTETHAHNMMREWDLSVDWVAAIKEMWRGWGYGESAADVEGN